MLTIKEVETIVSRDIGTDVTVLESNDNTAIVRYNKSDYVEYAVMKFNERGCYSGRYFPSFSQPRECARNSAWTAYKNQTA